ncbi:hypothetical protein B0H16DRAFT_1507694 [Mycena metata]|uniref:Uncharacterized protein n=1 Tax=Mycena metata TaxID=1033252 RepID=A0AAD7K046_9AGAR|nr:hypothetical protein B0H16DRAFT_1507694 [Mycena metata]
MAVPQELVGEVSDRDTLKACALAASCFLQGSQRILFRTLRIVIAEGRPRIAESPHLFGYTKDVTLTVSPRATAEDIEHLRQALFHLSNVRRCRLCRDQRHKGPTWTDLVTPVVFDFITATELDYLAIDTFTQVPHSTLAGLFSCTKTLCLDGMSMSTDNQDAVPPTVSRTQNLLLFPESRQIGKMLLLPQFRFAFAQLRIIWTPGVHGDHVIELLSLSAPHLQEILPPLDYLEGLDFPPLPALRIIDLRGRRFDPRAQRILTQLLVSSGPYVEEIRFAFQISSADHSRSPMEPATMAALVATLATYPSVRLSWSVSFGARIPQNERDECLARFTDFIQRSIPRCDIVVGVNLRTSRAELFSAWSIY